ncbi:hypothetical protein GFS31_41580 (plasmid) [Leptolyngbya sp. BL0902]|uniref:hypothetical protein n=1 Tax=Leptolyngbya sp. BL0902 TaxID=1115757 RepID=UPI0018E87920|nr:hypothetical protein [Leptolyngbya sp. BL0902]QQE67445.1 hypothetical protein GFS31_41580 [Leptolyngbya sp. BL0902]
MTHPSSQTQPLSPALDLALFELLATLETFSDADFNAHWTNLTEAELQQVALILLQALTVNLNGKQVAGALRQVRPSPHPLH